MSVRKIILPRSRAPVRTFVLISIFALSMILLLMALMITIVVLLEISQAMLAQTMRLVMLSLMACPEPRDPGFCMVSCFVVVRALWLPRARLRTTARKIFVRVAEHLALVINQSNPSAIVYWQMTPHADHI